MLRKTVLATAIVGAGLGSMTGAAFAGDDPGDGGHNWDDGHSHSHGHHGSWDHDKSTSCDNGVKQFSATKGGALADVAGGDNVAVPVNVCHVLDDNKLLNNIHVSLLSSTPDAGLPL
ncbi:hypothetical protein [Actinomycetospora sp. TBRC 11914]|uniref:hypothetical protein n=1 Tax=Actinomycetospora sp. TBRC 11914 TaxID=2729387 RepID=UPI00145D3CDD|nr:hypothetical protein [Actinomycetospora sp. TBRC 11914]NMO92579.1 hypothetical protein [Actinomycetospora sp. TBRC 11914]